MSKTKLSWKLHFVELIVVIIGITIAFTIEKYSEQLKERKEIKSILRSFADDLKRDINTYRNSQIPNNQRRVEELDYVLKQLRSEMLLDDSLHTNIRRMFGSANSKITNATYESVKSSGKLENISNEVLRKQIVNHYERNVSQSEYLSEFNIVFSDRLYTYVSEHSNAPFTKDYSDKNLLRDAGFRNMVSRWRGIIRFKVSEYERMAESSESLLEAIEAEVDITPIQAEH